MKKINTLFDGHDFIFAAGLGLLSYGASLIYWPAVYIVPGAILTALGLWSAAPRKGTNGNN